MIRAIAEVKIRDKISTNVSSRLIKSIFFYIMFVNTNLKKNEVSLTDIS